jgi:hypothetical protein
MVELLQPPKSPLQRSRFLRAWLSLVAVYSACDLTFPKDKLVAIAGVVNQIRTNTGLTFVGGVWEEILLECLLWRVGPFTRVRLTTGVPSWSWASIDGGVSRDPVGAYTPEWKAEVLHVPALDPMTGLSTSNDPSTNQLVLRASLKQVEWSQSGLVHDINPIDARHSPGEWWPDMEIPPGTKIWCLHIVLWTSADPGDKPEDAGLVVVPRHAARNEWSRIGWFKQEREADEEQPMFFGVEPQTVRLV